MSTYVITDLRPTYSPASRAESRTSELHLTRRGRVVVFMLALAAVLAFSVLIIGGSVATSEKGTPTPTETIVVGQGDTLWAIASDIAAETGERDVRNVMAQIEDLNGLESGMLRAGQELRIPLAD